MWTEMASLMAMLREFEADKSALQTQVGDLNVQVGKLNEDRQVVTLGIEKMNDKVDQYIAGA